MAIELSSEEINNVKKITKMILNVIQLKVEAQQALDACSKNEHAAISVVIKDLAF